jgi:hypothetical protein
LGNCAGTAGSNANTLLVANMRVFISDIDYDASNHAGRWFNRDLTAVAALSGHPDSSRTKAKHPAANWGFTNIVEYCHAVHRYLVLSRR